MSAIRSMFLALKIFSNFTEPVNMCCCLKWAAIVTFKQPSGQEMAVWPVTPCHMLLTCTMSQSLAAKSIALESNILFCWLPEPSMTELLG